MWSNAFPRAALPPSFMLDLQPSLLALSQLMGGKKGHITHKFKNKSSSCLLTTCCSHPCPPLTPACHSAQPYSHVLNFCHFFVFTKHCRDGTGVQIWTLASLVRGKSHFMSVQAQVLCVCVCVWLGTIYDGGFFLVLA